MGSRTARFWGFQAIFWSVAGAALFLSGVTQMPVFESFIRNLFLLIAGFLSSFFLAMAIDEVRWLRTLHLRIASYAIAYVVAVFCVVFINAVSYTLSGESLDELTFGHWFAGAMNLGLIYAFWSELFIQQAYLSEKPPESRPTPDKLIVDHRGALVPLQVDEIGVIVAAGDYVEVHAGGSTYLDRNTLQSVEQTLGDERFVRVHRSRLVNAGHVVSVTPLGKGRFRLELRDGMSVESSRGYREEVKRRLLSGAD